MDRPESVRPGYPSTMEGNSCIDAARRYVEFSNGGWVDEALAMFAPDASYASSQVGAFEGRDAIGAMMRGFFARFEQPHWDVPEYRLVGDDVVEFDFVMTASPYGVGDPVERRGTERIAFDATGLINRIDVDVRS